MRMFSRTAWAVIVTLLIGLAAKAVAAEATTPIGDDLSNWNLKGDKSRSHWVIGSAKLADKPSQLQVEEQGDQLVNAQGGGVDISTKEKFGDSRVEVEVMLPKGSNSGIYLMGEYEIQVFDSFGKQQLGQGDMGAIYSAAAPPVNATKAPGEWQKYVIEYQAPRFNDQGAKTENLKIVKVVLNGQTLHENVEVKGPTPGGLTGKEAPRGPLMFQGDHGPVAYRNLKITPLEGSK